MSASLTQRLQTLADAHRETLNLIHELRKFSPTSYSPEDPEDRRVELATEIHDNLREQEDTLEILRQELEDDAVPAHRRDPIHRGQRDSEHERNADLLARLEEDLKIARVDFRRAQLEAKRNLEKEKRKQREQLFTDRKNDGHPRMRPTHEKLTQDELAVRAADDVTMALRRVHNQLEGELAQSQFAQQTLEESQQALESLTESYSGTTDLLKASRGFVTQLVRSTKSDTWFLKSSFYLLAVTICWLFYRRILYGPMMLFIWWPIRILLWSLSGLGSAILGRPDIAPSFAKAPSLSISMPGTKANGMPTLNPKMRSQRVELPAKGAGWDRRPAQPSVNADSILEKVGRMIEETSTTVDYMAEGQEKEKAQDEQPRNSLKRMMEVEVETATTRDEL
ncbi:hypothetical protein A1O1_05194 [Capronia coronata CBS 617.96]|uniref:Sec20 C-terminal domain-containing protein n=1 Tax=Capronia coronata CBS 617.96 TaxID=1182541 RepID=W9Z158_9EURO|nr:uncharacterized protein A1O1_05194 [Capronia coronata CBS 617.96]EXJ88264.1 hypothetical protein A1O1_05194 [Capronia coronata CBS 617.96]